MRPGDIVLVRGRGWVARSIRHFTRAPRERPTLATHCALAVTGSHVVEAVFGRGVVVRAKRAGQAWRPKTIPPDVLARIVSRAWAREGESYGWEKILLHALDGLMGGAYVFRRLAVLSRRPHCALLVGDAFASEGYTFGGHGAPDPDTIHDFVTTHPSLYEQVPDVRF